METQTTVSPTSYSMVSPSRNRKSDTEISELSLKLHCENHTKQCHEKIESKIKLAVLDLRLWIVTSLVVFLLGFGGSVMCGMRQIGNIEERIANQGETIKKLDTQIESLRQEIWEVTGVGGRRSIANHVPVVGDNYDTKNSNVPSVANRGANGTGITGIN